MEKILIVMPVWNQLNFTEQMIDSLREFTNPDAYELLIIDNGSTDGTVVRLHEYEKLYGNVHCIFNEANEGWTGACNQAFKLFLSGTMFSDCSYILLANNDILLQEDWLPKMMKRFKDPKVGIVGPTSDFVAGFQTIGMNIAGFMTEEVKLLVGFFFLMRREVLVQTGLFDEATFGKMGGGEEFDFCIRARSLGWKCVIARDVFIKHFGSQTLSLVAGGKPGSDAYNIYCGDKDKKLIEKWGDAALHAGMDERLKVMMCIPIHTNYSGHKSFWISLMMMAKPGKWEVIEVTRAMVADARNLMVQKALELGGTHLLFVDDDHIIPSDAAIQLLQHDVDIVGALAFQRKKPFAPCVYNACNTPDNELGLTPVSIIKQGLQEVTAIGFSFVMIKIEVFKKLEFPWFVYGDKSLGIHAKLGGLGEDLSFCIRAGNAGYKIFCDTDLIVPHIGEPVLVDDTNYLEFYEKAKMETAEIVLSGDNDQDITV